MNKTISVTNDFFAEEFLKHFFCEWGRLLYWRESYFYHAGNYYKPMSENDLQMHFSKFAESFFNKLKESGERFTLDEKFSLKTVWHKVKISAHLSEEVEKNTFLSTGIQKNVLVLKNGMVDLDTLAQLASVKLMPLTSDYFNFAAISHDVNDVIKLNNFESFINSVLPDEKDRLLIQEIFGYTLYPNCKFQKIFILVGEGSNGKSALLLILRLMLGSCNISSVSLEAIDPARSFLLATMDGKYANLSEDMNEVNKVAEGTLKQLACGESLLIEKKFKDPYPTQIFAKQIFSTNNLPRWSDRSDGMMRRVVAVPFTQNFRDEAKRRLEFSEADFWLNSGELPSILKWSLDGLRRLLLQGHFTESESVKLLKTSYKSDCNPTSVFLEDNVLEADGLRVASSVIYRAYSEWCNQNGHHALSATSFSKEIKRKFPKAEIDKNATAYEGTRTRFWTGLKFLPHFDELYQQNSNLRAINF